MRVVRKQVNEHERDIYFMGNPCLDQWLAIIVFFMLIGGGGLALLDVVFGG